MSFFQTYKKSIMGAVIALVISGGIPTTMWIHNAYADERYVSKVEDKITRIKQYDDKIFECRQGIAFAETAKERAKWEALKEYYENKKAALTTELEHQGR